MTKDIKIGSVMIGGDHPFVLIAGPCVIESKRVVMDIARKLKEMTSRHRIPFIFKASYDKANRTSRRSFRGVGIDAGLDILQGIRQKLRIPVTSDVHTVEEAQRAGAVLDLVQIPAFLCRQTDLLCQAGRTGKPVNIKKGQFLAPWDMKHAIEKVTSTGNRKIILTERGTTFGYNNLVTDFCSLAIMRRTGYPVVLDASHSVQQPGGLGQASGGRSEFIPLMARCGMAAGCNGLFMEVHSNPGQALSDAANMLSLKRLDGILGTLKKLDSLVRRERKSGCP